MGLAIAPRSSAEPDTSGNRLFGRLWAIKHSCIDPNFRCESNATRRRIGRDDRAGCSALLGTDQPTIDEGIDPETNDTAVDDVTYTLATVVSEDTAGSEWTAIGATYPRDAFRVDSAGHENVTLGVDMDGDDEMEQTFDESHVSGVNNNDFSFAVTLDIGYTLQTGDVVMVTYSAVDNPDEPGEYTVAVRLNGQQTTNTTVSIE